VAAARKRLRHARAIRTARITAATEALRRASAAHHPSTAPATHTSTGASASSGEHEHEDEHEDHEDD
jgi:hypothetical protein